MDNEYDTDWSPIRQFVIFNIDTCIVVLEGLDVYIILNTVFDTRRQLTDDIPDSAVQDKDDGRLINDGIVIIAQSLAVWIGIEWLIVNVYGVISPTVSEFGDTEQLLTVADVFIVIVTPDWIQFIIEPVEPRTQILNVDVCFNDGGLRILENVMDVDMVAIYEVKQLVILSILVVD